MATGRNPGRWSLTNVSQFVRTSFEKFWQSRHRAWVVVGGLAGLIAIVGVLIAVVSLLQDRATIVSQDAAQATMIEIGEQQLAVQKEIATFQASDVRPGPTATAIAERVMQLMNTQKALEAESRRIESTLAAFASRSAISVNANPTPECVATQVSGVCAELVELSQCENTVTANVRYVNSGEVDQSLWVTRGSYLLDETTSETYQVMDQSNSLTASVPAHDSLDVWAKYRLPEGIRPQQLTAVFRQGLLFEHILVQSE